MKNILKTAACAVALSLLASCGGGNAGTPVLGGGTGTGTGTGGTPTAATLTLQLSATNIQNGVAATVAATATASTSTGQVVANIPVTFSVDNNATFSQSTAVTDTNGQSVATVSIGADPSNRIVTVTATSSGLAPVTASFAVTGSKLSGTPNPAIVLPGSTGNKVDFTLVNSNAAPMANQSITVTAGSLGTVTAQTDTNGKYSYVYTAPVATGALMITATAANVTNTQTILVQSGSTSVPPATDGNGLPGVVASASVSANPSVVSTNTTTTSNQTEVRALFVGAGNSPLKNVRVVFDLAGDLNQVGGTFSTGSNVVYTDATGVATTSYIPGVRESPTNGVTIRACYSTTDFTAGTCPQTPIAATTTITVVSDPLAVSIGTNGVIVVPTANLTYIRQYVVLVVDASGRAKANVDIVPSLDLPLYLKGAYVHGTQWVVGTVDSSGTVTLGQPVGCINEDTNRNGILEVTEDINHSGSLEPRKSDATITILGTGKTDANGSATVQVEYPQNVGSWLQIKILVSATGVSGTEGRATWTEILPVPSSAITGTTTPPFAVSPYGSVVTSTSPTDLIPGATPPVATLPDGKPGSAAVPAGSSTVPPCYNPY